MEYGGQKMGRKSYLASLLGGKKPKEVTTVEKKAQDATQSEGKVLTKTLIGAGKGAIAGSAAGPVGIVVGGVLGAIEGMTGEIESQNLAFETTLKDMKDKMAQEQEEEARRKQKSIEKQMKKGRQGRQQMAPVTATSSNQMIASTGKPQKPYMTRFDVFDSDTFGGA